MNKKEEATIAPPYKFVDGILYLSVVRVCEQPYELPSQPLSLRKS